MIFLAIGLYTLIDEERLMAVLSNLHEVIELPIRLVDAKGDSLYAFGQAQNFCALLKDKVYSKETCRGQYKKAAQRAEDLGEAYIFACHASLNHIAFPLLSQGELLGSVIIGPFLMDTPDSTLISTLAQEQRLNPSLALELYDSLHGLQVVSPRRVTQLGRLADHLLKPLLPGERAMLMHSQQKLYQQSRINETVQMYKEQGVTPVQSDMYQKETELMTKVKTGNIKQAKALLNDLLGYVLFSQGGELDMVRTRAIELTILLSRVAMEGGAKAETIYPLNSQYLLMMSRDQSFEDICLRLQDVVEGFMSAMFSGFSKENSHIRKALAIMSQRYAQPLTLSAVAAEVGLSPNYLSSLFGRIVGLSFREQLSRIRIEESKRLLLSSDYPLAAIASAMGFADQSYFCKVFKRVTGVKPGQYRQ